MQVLYLVDMKPVTIPKAIGDFLASFRAEHNLTLEQIAREARDYGATWSASSVRNIENGSAQTSLPNLLSLTLALNALCDTELTLSDLLGDAESFSQPSGLNQPLKRSWINEVLTGAPVRFGIFDLVDGVEEMHSIVSNVVESFKDYPPLYVDKDKNLHVGEDKKPVAETQTSLAEQRAAKKIGINVVALKYWAQHLYGQSLEAEASIRALDRSRQTGSPVTAQAKGAMTRHILQEINQAIESKKDGQTA